jgi:putative transcriptional regulator
LKTTSSRKPARRRTLFAELSEGFTALAEARDGKRTLRTHASTCLAVPEIAPADILRLRKRMNVSRGVLADYLRTNVRTLENWEQGRAKPNAQAALLIELVTRYPDTIARLATLGSREAR